MIVAFGLSTGPSRAQIHTGSFAPYITGPTALNTELDSWLAIHADNTATVYIGFAELGQGTSTALPRPMALARADR